MKSLNQLFVLMLLVLGCGTQIGCQCVTAPCTEIPNDALKLVVTIQAEPGQRDFVQAELSKIIEPSLKDSGCLQYALFSDNENSDTLILIEAWESHAIWLEHMEQPHVKAFVTAIEGKVKDLHIYQLAYTAGR
ncbi:putative quinol monooxygenase [Coraliomargarita akajimensis]|uniref:Antibiotic biosynthesis monooxygenase n=1 Tax=Coraliomargarita akajimensis (strain DSM 45221 / IAM 15411 / JCM 23193 / KCTC 12865 / 04OKA010-24) TaxID=583355 RepID=D5EPH9_CORAD|nr:putative quinol monooxygenase [Coraliomargarita akajimensis]ADE53716.1 Antibiotic biosynthesis monooxygenase [Coraliomargarita akajimensis DSM 45221]